MSESDRVAGVGSLTRPRYSRGIAAIAAMVLGFIIALAAPVLSTAQAEEAPVSPAPSTSQESRPESTAPATKVPTETIAPTTSPQIESPGNGQFIGSNRTTVSGSKTAGREIRLLSPRGGEPLCIVDDSSTTWSCENLHLQNGPTVKLRVVVTGDTSLNDEIAVSVLGAPTVLGGLTGPESNGWVRGTGHPQATVTAALANGETCSSTADNSGAWACLFEGTVANGSQEVTASQLSAFSRPTSSNSSEPVTILFDLDAPPAPVVTTPANGAQVPVTGTAYSGTGETGATVTVFAGAYSVCSAVVTNKAWTCSAGGVDAGSYPVSAVQKDAAGNVGRGSAPVSVSYGPATTPSPGPTPTPAQSAPAPPAAPPAAPTPSDAASPSPDDSAAVPDTTTGPTPSPTPDAGAPGNDSSGPGRGGASAFPGKWDDPTQFAAAIGPIDSSSPFPWFRAGLLALGALLLIAVPLRVLASTLSRTRGGRPLRAMPVLAGRNQAREEFEVAPTIRVNRWLRGGAALLAAATFVMLSGDVVDQPAYLRLLVAVTIGLMLVNAVALLVPLWWSSRVLRLRGTVTFLPRYLMLIAAAAIASRWFDVHPALLFGLLGSVALSARTDAAGPARAKPTSAQRGQLAAVRVGALTALAVIAWSLEALLPSARNFTTSLAAETGNTIVLAAIGSAVLILVPIGHTSGRSILAWSPLIWTGMSVVTYGVFFAALAPMIDQLRNDGVGLVLWLVAATFAALCASLWAWQRFVAPTQR